MSMDVNQLKITDKNGLDVYVFQVCEYDAVAAHNDEEALAWYMEKTGIPVDELYSLDEIETVLLDKEVCKSEDERNISITVREIIEENWRGEPFIAITTY